VLTKTANVLLVNLKLMVSVPKSKNAITSHIIVANGLMLDLEIVVVNVSVLQATHTNEH